MPVLHPPVLPYGPSQEPTLAEWARKTKPDGSPYIRGFHGGQDHQSPDRRCLAVAVGSTRWVDFGPSLGRHQFVVARSDGTGDFYAHTSSRLSDGSRVEAGDFVAWMSDEGIPGAVHLHYERLRKWHDWWSSFYDPQLHDLWEEYNMALSDDDKEWLSIEIHRQVRGGIQALGAALFDGSNSAASDWIPDTSGWAARLKHNLEAIHASQSAGVDPAVITEAVKQAQREGTGAGG